MCGFNSLPFLSLTLADLWVSKWAVPQATVLIPTHDHADTLYRSVRSAQEQSMGDLEIFIVGDGVPERTREVCAELALRDSRIRFFDQPKGPRHGELHRHQALQQASSPYVLYLTDDDLWFPEHVETVCELLECHDFVGAIPIAVRADQTLRSFPGRLELEASRRMMTATNRNFVSLACGAHRLDFYRRLPFGWRTTPQGTHTDLYMWQQLLSMPNCRATSLESPSVVIFPSPWRKGWTHAQRLEELDQWQERLSAASFRRELIERYFRQLARDAAEINAERFELLARVQALTSHPREMGSSS